MFFNINPSELRKLLLFFTIICLISFCNTIISTVFRSFILQSLGMKFLPYSTFLMVVFTVLTYLYLLKFEKHTQIFFILTTAISAVLLIVFGVFVTEKMMTNIYYYYALFLFFSFLASFAITMSTFLANLFNSSFSPSRLRLLSPITNVSPVLGVILGGATVNIAIPFIGFLWLISIVGFFLLIVAGLNELYRRSYSSNDARAKMYFEKKEKEGNRLFSVLSFFRTSPMAFTIFAAVIFIVTSLQIIDFQYTSTVNATFTDPTDAARFFSYYNFLASPLVIFVTLFATGPILGWLGVSTSLLIRPLLISFCFLGVIIHKGIVEVTVLRFVSDFSAIIFWLIPYSLLYNALPIEMRGVTRNTITGVVRMTMEGIASILIFVLAHFPALTPWVGLFISVIWLVFQVRSRYVYLNTLVSNLKDSNRHTLFDALESLEEANEPVAFQALSRFLLEQKNQLDTEAMIKAIDVISHLKNTDAIRPLAQLIYHPDFYIRYHAIFALQTLVDQRKSHSVVLYFLLHEIKKAFYTDPSGLVRIEAGRFLLKFTPEHKIMDFINEILENKDVYGRVLCIQTISKLNSSFMDLLIRLYLDDPHPLVRTESIIALWPFKEYALAINQQLTRLLEGTEEEVIDGLIVLIRVKNAENFHSTLEKYIMGQKGSQHLKAIAGMAGLVQYTPYTPEWQESLNVLINILCDKEYSLTQREFLVELLKYVDDDITDLLITTILELPKDVQNVAKQGFNRLVKILSQKEISQETISPYA